jgi:ankyrin repeat protein
LSELRAPTATTTPMDGSLPNALIAAVRAGDVLEVRRILRGYGGRRVDLNQLDMFGNTALHWAVTSGGEVGTEIARLLIQAGAKVNVPNEENQTPLLRACRLGRHDTVDALLDADAVVTGTDSEGGTVCC